MNKVRTVFIQHTILSSLHSIMFRSQSRNCSDREYFIDREQNKIMTDLKLSESKSVKSTEEKDVKMTDPEVE